MGPPDPAQDAPAPLEYLTRMQMISNAAQALVTRFHAVSLKLYSRAHFGQ
jgi:hypothetical protein